MTQTHVEEVLLKAVSALRNLRLTMDSPVHALIWARWGTGKTRAAQKVASQSEDVFYVKIPEGDVTKGRLYRLLGLAMRSGVRNTYEGTLDLMRYHVLTKNVKPIFILDEAQRVLRRPKLLSELKDLSEDLDLQFSYIFLGDKDTPGVMSANPHSIHKRILFKKELQPITLKTVKALMQAKKVEGSAEELLEVARKKAWTTLEVAFVLSALKASKKKAHRELILEVAGRLGL